jgi:hypothetical protein
MKGDHVGGYEVLVLNDTTVIFFTSEGEVAIYPTSKVRIKGNVISFTAELFGEVTGECRTDGIHYRNVDQASGVVTTGVMRRGSRAIPKMLPVEAVGDTCVREGNIGVDGAIGLIVTSVDVTRGVAVEFAQK